MIFLNVDEAHESVDLKSDDESCCAHVESVENKACVKLLCRAVSCSGVSVGGDKYY